MRISLSTSVPDAIAILSNNNEVVYRLLQKLSCDNAQIDPQDEYGPLGPLMALQQCGVRGMDVERLYQACCSDYIIMLMVLRARQLGHLEQVELQAMVNDPQKVVAARLQELEDLVRTDLIFFNTK